LPLQCWIPPVRAPGQDSHLRSQHPYPAHPARPPGEPPQRQPHHPGEPGRHFQALESQATPRCDDRLSSVHHRRVIRRPAGGAKPVGLREATEIHLIHRPQHRPHQMILRQPLTQRRRHQQQLTTLTTNEFSSHPRSVLNRSDGTDIPTASRPCTREPAAAPATNAIVRGNDRRRLPVGETRRRLPPRLQGTLAHSNSPRRGRLGPGEGTAIRRRSRVSRTDRSVSPEAHNDSEYPPR
jgi:hypothetical protein